MDQPTAATVRARRPRSGTPARREEIVRAAARTFAEKGYRRGSLAEVAEQVGITHAGVLHHFGSKEQLLVAVLQQRDEDGLRDLADGHDPRGRELFAHLVRTMRANERRAGIVQGYTVLVGEAVTAEHPAREWVTRRFGAVRTSVADAVQEMGPHVGREAALRAAEAVVAVMDGLQVQWLLDDSVELADTSAFAIEAILAAVLAGPDAPRPVGDVPR